MMTRLIAIQACLLVAASAAAVDAPAPAGPGTVKVGMNVFATWYGGTMPAYANILLNGRGFNGGPSTDDGVPRKSGFSWILGYSPKATPGMFPASSDDPGTWYKLCYHCDDPDPNAWRDGHEKLDVGTGFTIAKEPTSDGKGNFTGWLRFDEGRLGQWSSIVVTVLYGTDQANLNPDGTAKYPISKLQIRFPGCSDSDFFTPVFRQRMGGFARLRFCDAGGMNGRNYLWGLAGPGGEAAKSGRAVVAGNSPENVQTECRNGAGLSWGAGVGHGNPMTFWNGKEWTTFPWGFGCRAPCTMVFPLRKSYSLLLCGAAVDHEADQGRPGQHGDVTLSVWTSTVDKPGDADWTKAKEFKHMTTASGQVGFTLDLRGVANLKFVADDNGDADGHLDLINPRLWRISQWKDRSLPSSCACSCTNPLDGTALEYLIRMCDETGADAMFNVPISADDGYLVDFARLLMYGSDERGAVYTAPQEHPVNPPLDLAHGRVVYLEEDNEVWNLGYNCWFHESDKGNFLGHSVSRQFALDAKHMSEVIKREFAAAGYAKSVKIVYSDQLDAERISQDAFDFLAKEDGGKPASTWFDCYAMAPYFGPSPGAFDKNATLDEIFARTERGLDERIRSMRKLVAFAARNGLEPTTYEGGLEMTVDGSPAVTQLRQAMASRRAGRILDRYFAAWRDAAGPDAITNYYSSIDAARFQGGGQWAVLPCLSGKSAGSARYDAILRASHPAGDCDNDQAVTYADFQILKRNFGTGHWWSEGDFNNDGDVGLDDLELMYAHLSEADRQRPEVAAFAAEHFGPWVPGPTDDPQGGYTLTTWKDDTEAQAVALVAREPGDPAAWKKPFSLIQVAAPRHGALALGDYPRVGYTPAKDYAGLDDCVVAVRDADGKQSNPVNVWIEVRREVPPLAVIGSGVSVLAPAVSLSPSSTTLTPAPRDILLKAEARAFNGASIAKVEFHDGDEFVGAVTGAPFTYRWKQVEAGDHSVIATATDDRGASAVSAPSLITVASAALGGKDRPVMIPPAPATFAIDGDFAKWEGIAAIPAPFARKPAGMLKLAWNEAGLFGCVQAAVANLSVNPGQPWTGDCLELWLETDGSRAALMHANACQLVLAPDPKTGEGKAIAVKAQGALGKAEIETRWKKTATGYELEFCIPAKGLAPAKPATGVHLGFNYAVSHQGGAIEQFFADKNADESWGSPMTWGVIELGR